MSNLDLLNLNNQENASYHTIVAHISTGFESVQAWSFEAAKLTLTLLSLKRGVLCFQSCRWGNAVWMFVQYSSANTCHDKTTKPLAVDRRLQATSMLPHYWLQRTHVATYRWCVAWTIIQGLMSLSWRHNRWAKADELNLDNFEEFLKPRQDPGSIPRVGTSWGELCSHQPLRMFPKSPMVSRVW